MDVTRDWLQRFKEAHGLASQRVAQVLGVNQARVSEWLQGLRPVPDEAVEALQRWEADGCPRFQYWVQ